MSYIEDPFLITDLLRLQFQLKFDKFIETGTEQGNSTRTILNWIPNVYTCESQHYEAYWEGATWSKNPNGWYDFRNPWNNRQYYKFWNESSIEALPKMLSLMEDSNFYLYLDSHVDFLPPGVLPPEPPLLEELKILAQSNLQPVIIIHDFNTERDGWVYYEFVDNKSITLEYVKESMDVIYGIDNWDYHFNPLSKQRFGAPNGCAYFYPKGKVDKEKLYTIG